MKVIEIMYHLPDVKTLEEMQVLQEKAQNIKFVKGAVIKQNTTRVSYVTHTRKEQE